MLDLVAALALALVAVAALALVVMMEDAAATII
jgi:hypothetical protein